ncbi:tRNA (adenosine(37)-N6)-dimethylallyltransferase MiaA [Lapidilactobacillus bayanensis]|uniref:tRNA (adenosine(37)-N6)-dimethylallyltransferase MiaA n=1 Tax=Lapidilactobacillus bayanensis TaxID=2485998 RepID=UPI000F777A2C|nr:tRNA (adenosine(37)-N6)-dimethylallyltransferase MiaA [Lapidilactobacillus bayanensis]
MKPKVLVIVGPTAVGKTALSLELAQKFAGEIISGDSMQVYRHLNIGTAKATAAEQAVASHHLIDICDVNQEYSAFQFKQLATAKINEITARQHLPIIVGGTGFYIRSLLENLDLGGAEKSGERNEIRHQLEQRLIEIGPENLWQELQQKDPAAASKIPISNSRRVIRALEVIQRTGALFSVQTQHEQPFDALVLGLNLERGSLYQHINRRVEQMLAEGLTTEAKWLFAQVPPTAQAAKGIGYREFRPYFNQEIDLATVQTQIQIDSRHYAKRQLTYFRNQLPVPVNWFDLLKDGAARDQIEVLIAAWLNSSAQI